MREERMVKTAIADLLVSVNAFAPFRYINRDKLLVLMYHRFSAGEEFGKTSAETFERHLEYLVRNYNVSSLSDAVKILGEGRELPARTAVMTVDDGYRDFYDIAYPALKRYGVSATFYTVTDFIDGTCWIWTDIARYITLNTKKDALSFRIREKAIDKKLNGPETRIKAAASVNAELKKLPDSEKDSVLKDFASAMGVSVPETPTQEFGPISWDEARQMERDGMDIGSHTVTHPILTNIDDDRLAVELDLSLEVVRDRLQKDIVNFCYPNGTFSTREQDAARKAGYYSAVTTEADLCVAGEDRFLIPRVAAEPEMYRFVQATSGFDAIKAKIR